MAESSEGWDGTVNEAAIARILGTAAQPRIESGGELTVVAGQRRVVLSPIVTHHAFIRYVNTSASTFDLPVPATGRWHLLVERRNWEANTVSHVMLASETTVTDPASISLPATYPDTFADQPGVVADFPLYWVWVRASDNLVITRPIIHGRPYLAQTGSLSQENSGIVPAGGGAQYMNFAFGSAIRAGTLMHFWCQVDLYTPAGNYGGLIQVVRLDGSSQILIGQARWHNHARGERWLYPTADFSVVAGSDFAAGTQFSLIVTNDSGSSGGVEVWFPRASWHTI